MDIDYSPTGREFVTGSYDRTVSVSYICSHFNDESILLIIDWTLTGEDISV